MLGYRPYLNLLLCLRSVPGVLLSMLLVPAHIVHIPHLLMLLPPPLRCNPRPRLRLIPHSGCALDVKCHELTFGRGVLSGPAPPHLSALRSYPHHRQYPPSPPCPADSAGHCSLSSCCFSGISLYSSHGTF